MELPVKITTYNSPAWLQKVLWVHQKILPLTGLNLLLYVTYKKSLQ